MYGAAVAATLLALMTSGILPGGRPPPATPRPAAPGVVTLDGTPVDVFGDRTARAVALIFVEPDCPVARRALPRLNRLVDDVTPRGVRVWLVYPSAGTAAIATQIREFGIRVPVLRDTAHTLVGRAEITVTPEAAVFDAAGRLLYRGRVDDQQAAVGTMRPAPTREDLRDALGEILQDRLSAPRFTPAVGCHLHPPSRR